MIYKKVSAYWLNGYNQSHVIYLNTLNLLR